MKTKKCPVCDWDIKDDGIKVKVGGKEIVVCCDDCARKRRPSRRNTPAQPSDSASPAGVDRAASAEARPVFVQSTVARAFDELIPKGPHAEIAHHTDEVRGEYADPAGERHDDQLAILRRRAGIQECSLGSNDFTCVTREHRAGFYLCQGDQGQPGTWVWIRAEDVAALYEEYKASGAKIRHAPRNYPWAYEMKVEDPDGHILRFGSEPLSDRPFEDFTG